MKILCVHGIGGSESDLPSFEKDWTSLISTKLQMAGLSSDISVDFFLYDTLFKNTNYPEAKVYFEILKSFFEHDKSLAEKSFQKGIIDDTFGMVVKWLGRKELREELRKNLNDKFKNNYDLIVAYSLGTLISYDTLIQNKNTSNKPILATFASQLSHRVVRKIAFGGRLEPISSDNCRFWINTYNPDDRVLVGSLENYHFPSEAFIEKKVDSFKLTDVLNHDAIEYFTQSISSWQEIAHRYKTPTRELKLSKYPIHKSVAPKKKALLVGIDEYSLGCNLQGCVNDVYSVSSFLQEKGYEASSIRLLTNKRAVKKELLSRLDWLLSDAKEMDELVFYYSGHGTQIPEADLENELDYLDECLVLHDFNWSNPENTLLKDKEFFEIYSQLPYKTNFIAIFDSCHSGGMARSGLNVKGLSIPEDIRHRLLQWDKNVNQWIPRKIKPYFLSGSKYNRFQGNSGNTRKLGLALSLRNKDDKTYQDLCSSSGHRGPYLPIIFEACEEGESAYELSSGNLKQGVFTYYLLQTVKENPSLSLLKILEKVKASIKNSGYNQHPQIIYPSSQKGWKWK